MIVNPIQRNWILEKKTRLAILDPDSHIVISVVSGVTIRQILRHIDKRITFIRAMPNTAVAIRESMTCLASNGTNSKAIKIAKSIKSPLPADARSQV